MDHGSDWFNNMIHPPPPAGSKRTWRVWNSHCAIGASSPPRPYPFQVQAPLHRGESARNIYNERCRIFWHERFCVSFVLKFALQRGEGEKRESVQILKQSTQNPWPKKYLQPVQPCTLHYGVRPFIPESPATVYTYDWNCKRYPQPR